MIIHKAFCVKNPKCQSAAAGAHFPFPPFPSVFLVQGNHLLFTDMQTNGKRDFEVGDELQVKCTSFSSKAIPVVSLVDDE